MTTTPLADIQPLVDYLFQRPKNPFLQNALEAYFVYGYPPGLGGWYRGYLSYVAAKPPTNVAVLAGTLNLDAQMLQNSAIRVPSTSVVITLSDPIKVSTFDLNPIYPMSGVGPFFTTDAVTPDKPSVGYNLCLYFNLESSYGLCMIETEAAHQLKVIESVTAGLKIPKGLAAVR